MNTVSKPGFSGVASAGGESVLKSYKSSLIENLNVKETVMGFTSSLPLSKHIKHVIKKKYFRHSDKPSADSFSDPSAYPAS